MCCSIPNYIFYHFTAFQFQYTYTRVNEISSEAEKIQLCHLYRSQQIHHTVVLDILHHVLPTVIPVAELLLITSIYTVIKQFHSNHSCILFVTGSVGLVAFICLKQGIEMCGNLTRASEEFADLKSMKTNLPHENFSKHDRKFFESCRPFKITVANSFTLKQAQDTFVRIMDNVVISSVINLLVMF